LAEIRASAPTRPVIGPNWLWAGRYSMLPIPRAHGEGERKMGRGSRRRAQPADVWQELLPLFEWLEQQAYEEIRHIVLFGSPIAERARETGKPEAVGGPRLFETTHALPQLRLFALGDGEWLTAMKLEGYVLRKPADPMALQDAL
jgi:hypothetical protein